MYRRYMKFLNLWLSFLFFLGKSYGQEIPPIACPEYFQYLSYNNMFIGKVTLPVSGSGTTILELRFSQRGATNGNYGRVVTFYDRDTTRENLKNGLGLTYRVDFPFINVLPKLTRIAVNGQEICSAPGYPPPSSVIRMQHNLTITETIIQETKPFATDFGNNGGTNYVTYPDVTNDYFPNSIGSSFRPNFNQFITTTQYPVVYTTRQRPYRPPVQVQTARPIESPTVPRVVSQTPRVVPQAPRVHTITSERPQTTQPAASTRQEVSRICGRRTGGVETFIHHGTALIRGQFPWLTAIYEKVSGGAQFLCGGSLVSSRTVITAAHCFRSYLKAQNVLLYLGKYDLDDYSEAGYIPRQVKELYIHPEYNLSRIADADIAVMQLAQPVPFNDYISPICLWSGPEDLNEIIGLKGFVAGWGADENNRPISNIPKMINASIVDGDECRAVQGFSALVTPRTICAGNRDGSGPCKGDSGSGLMIERNQRWTLRGVVSAGQVIDGRCILENYVVYCDLAKHRSWIESHMAY